MPSDLSTSSSGDLEVFRTRPFLTVAIFHALVCGEKSRHLAEKKLRELRQDGLIEPMPFVRNKVVYALTQAGRKRLGVHVRQKSPGAHAIMRSVAAAALEVKLGITYIPKAEVLSDYAPAFFKGDWPRKVPSTFCFLWELDGENVFATAMFDMEKHIRRIHKSTEKIHRALPRDVRRSYRLVIVTGHEGKATVIRRLKLDHPVEVIVLPELGEML